MIEKPKIKDILDVIGRSEHFTDYLLLIYGPVNQDVIISTIRLAETKLRLQQFPSTLISRTKTICAEILQNVNKHQIKHELYQPYLVIGSQNHNLYIYSGNIISENSKLNIESKLENYFTVKEEDFKEFYIDSFKNSVLTSEGNAGLGLLDIFYRSNRNLKYNIVKVAENLFSFNINVELHHNALVNT
ncbi:MAG TPA: DUF6272 family protein [Bacteroidia bacterium]|nr:DUF6272 family protein [Bacteroidia bacterium]